MTKINNKNVSVFKLECPFHLPKGKAGIHVIFFPVAICPAVGRGLKKTKCSAERKSFSRISEQSLFLIAFSFFKTLPGCRAYSHSIFF